MTVRIYRSDDASAPVLSGQAGALIGVLDACLVNGYGSKDPAGWTKDFSGTNKAAYRPGAGNRHYVRLDDSPTQYPRVRGYEAMSDVDTGTGLFPTDAQFSGGLYIYKSNAASSAARPWIVIADEKRFYLWISWNGTSIEASATYTHVYFFGDIISFKSGDAFHTMLMANYAASDNQGGSGAVVAFGGVISGHYMARSYTQVGTSIQIGKHSGDVAKKAGTPGSLGVSGSTYPDPITGGILVTPVFVHESGIRGRMPGLWDVLHGIFTNNGDTFSGSGELAGKTFFLLDFANVNVRNRAAIEISDTWE